MFHSPSLNSFRSIRSINSWLLYCGWPNLSLWSAFHNWLPLNIDLFHGIIWLNILGSCSHPASTAQPRVVRHRLIVRIKTRGVWSFLLRSQSSWSLLQLNHFILDLELWLRVGFINVLGGCLFEHWAFFSWWNLDVSFSHVMSCLLEEILWAKQDFMLVSYLLLANVETTHICGMEIDYKFRLLIICLLTH